MRPRRGPHITDARSIRHANGALRGNDNFGLDHVFGPIAAAGGNVSRKGEVFECRKRDVMRLGLCRISSMPPHQTGIPLDRQRSWICRAGGVAPHAPHL